MADENLIRLTDVCNEGETLLLDLTFKDADGAGVVPPTGFWTLYNLADETIINNRSAVGMTPSASTYTIELSGSDNALIDECLFVEEHRFYFEYRHGDGGARTGNGEVQILVQNMHKK
jgi:hypothetical protein